jgi:hypothetical protein
VSRPNCSGCLIGYCDAQDDFRNKVFDGSTAQEDYKSGWKIYEFTVDAALMPNNKLVYHASASDEVWLTAYNSTTAEYVPEALTKIFKRSLRMVGRTGRGPESKLEPYAEITHDACVRFSENIFFGQGQLGDRWSDFQPRAVLEG